MPHWRFQGTSRCGRDIDCKKDDGSLARNLTTFCIEHCLRRRTWSSDGSWRSESMRQVQCDLRLQASSASAAAYDGSSVLGRQSERFGELGPDPRPRESEHDGEIHKTNTGSAWGSFRSAELLRLIRFGLGRIVPLDLAIRQGLLKGCNCGRGDFVSLNLQSRKILAFD